MQATMHGLRTTWGDDTYVVAAPDWANAAAPVCTKDDEGNWISTGKQVADFRHFATAALREQLRQAASFDGMTAEKAEEEIDKAIVRSENF